MFKDAEKLKKQEELAKMEPKLNGGAITIEISKSTSFEHHE